MDEFSVCSLSKKRFRRNKNMLLKEAKEILKKNGYQIKNRMNEEVNKPYIPDMQKNLKVIKNLLQQCGMLDDCDIYEDDDDYEIEWQRTRLLHS